MVTGRPRRRARSTGASGAPARAGHGPGHRGAQAAGKAVAEHHHRADDGPAYLTILIVGHLMAPLLHVMFVNFRPDPLVLATTFTIGCVGLSLYLLPRLKGAVVAFQWARRMHGFGTAD